MVHCEDCDYHFCNECEATWRYWYDHMWQTWSDTIANVWEVCDERRALVVIDKASEQPTKPATKNRVTTPTTTTVIAKQGIIQLI